VNSSKTLNLFNAEGDTVGVYDSPRKRTVFFDGSILWDEDRAVDYLFKHGHLPQDQKINAGIDTWAYDEIHGTEHGRCLSEVQSNVKVPRPPEDSAEFQERVIDIIESSPRYKHYSNIEAADERIGKELNYFFDQGYAGFILELYDLIKKFKQDNVLWGVGRGSSCASFVLYVMEVHDIDSIEFEIDFSELSKEHDD